MSFGTRTKDVKDTPQGTYLRSFRPGETTVRFCEEVQEWITFWEHFNSDNKSYPCTGDRSACPGCNSADAKEQKASRRFASTIRTPEGDFQAVRIPASVQKKMVTRSERNNGTILNRDYVIIREGQGLDTEYDVEADRTYEVAAKDLANGLVDIETILQSSWDEVWGEKKEDGGLADMSIRELRALAREKGVDSEVCELGSKDEIIKALS